MRHHMDGSLRCEASLVEVAVGIGRHASIGLLPVGGSCPAVVVVLCAEQVVHGATHGEVFHGLAFKHKSIGKTEVSIEIAIEHHAHIYGMSASILRGIMAEAGIGKVLFAYISALNTGTEAFIVESKDIIEKEIGRESQRRFSQAHHFAATYVYHPVFCLVGTKRSIGVPAEPINGFP